MSEDQTTGPTASQSVEDCALARLRYIAEDGTARYSIALSELRALLAVADTAHHILRRGKLGCQSKRRLREVMKPLTTDTWVIR